MLEKYMFNNKRNHKVSIINKVSARIIVGGSLAIS